jgi:hypothetical protein
MKYWIFFTTIASSEISSTKRTNLFMKYLKWYQKCISNVLYVVEHHAWKHKTLKNSKKMKIPPWLC